MVCAASVVEKFVDAGSASQKILDGVRRGSFEYDADDIALAVGVGDVDFAWTG